MKATLRNSLILVGVFATAGALAQPERPAPRMADGTISLGAPAGETGYWARANSRLVVDPNSYEAGRFELNARVHIDDVPLQPWARALTNYRHKIFLASEPYTRCKPASGPRQIMSPYGFEIVQVPDEQLIYIITISNAMSFRPIFMDGREHPTDVQPTYLGHSIGHWDRDTLVVDTVGMSEKTWMNRDGLPHTEQMHMVERFTRRSLETMDYTVTFDDPGAYTAPWTSGFDVSWEEGLELFEYICQENNISPDAMIGEGRNSKIFP